MKKILSILLILVLSISVFAGCGKTENKVAEKEVEKTEETAEKEEVAQEEVVETTEELGWPRTITDARGVELTLEKKPERIAAYDWLVTENLIALDSPPIAANLVEMLSSWPSVKDFFQKYKVEDLGREVTNFEKMLELKPDLILTSTWMEDEYDQLEKIAPIFVIDGPLFADDWRSSLREISKVIGEEEKAEQFIAQEKLGINEARKSLEKIDESVGFIFKGEGLFILNSESRLNLYYNDETGLGLKVPEGWPVEDVNITLEALSEIDPDIIFLINDNYDEVLSEMSGNSVWEMLKAVKNNKIYPIHVSATMGTPTGSSYGVKVILEALAE